MVIDRIIIQKRLTIRVEPKLEYSREWKVLELI